MDKKYDKVTWMHNKEELITFVNNSSRNYILELPTGRLRLDAGRSIKASVNLAADPRIKELVDKGDLTISR